MVASQLPVCDRCMGSQPPNGAFLCDQGGKVSQHVSMVCPQNSINLASAEHTGVRGETRLGLCSVSQVGEAVSPWGHWEGGQAGTGRCSKHCAVRGSPG